MPDRTSSSHTMPNLRLLLSLVASILGLTLVGAGLSEPFLSAVPGAQFAASQAPATAASAGTLITAALAGRRMAFTTRRDRVPDGTDPRHALPLATRLRGTPPERPPGHIAALGTGPPLPVFWLPPPASLADQLYAQHGLTPWNRIHTPAPATTPDPWRGKGRHPIDGEPISTEQETPASS